MKTPWKIPVVCLQLLLVLALLLGIQATVKADQLDEGIAALQEGKYKKALEKLRPLAEQGDAHAQYFLGAMYNLGEGVLQDSTEAAKWYRKAAEQGFVLAQNKLGGMYHRGDGVPQDEKEAVKWYRKAAEQGYPQAKKFLAGDGGITGTYERIDGNHKLVINSDLTFESINTIVKKKFKSGLFGESNTGENNTIVKKSNRGLYEVRECWSKLIPNNKGNVIFYTADGDSCCVVLRKLGSKTLVEHIWGEEYGICVGGVYERQ